MEKMQRRPLTWNPTNLKHCPKHKIAHFVFEDGTNACLSCIDAEAREWKDLLVDSLEEKIEGKANRQEWEPVFAQARTLGEMTGETPSYSLAWVIVALGMRRDLSYFQIIDEVIQAGPDYFLDQLTEFSGRYFPQHLKDKSLQR
jgi:hypothetical protein